MGSALRQLLSHCQGGVLHFGQAQGVQLPSIPSDTIASFQEFVEVSLETESHLIVRLIASIQVLSARMREIKRRLQGGLKHGDLVLPEDLRHYVVDAAEVYAYSAAMFDYARFEENVVPKVISIDDIRTAINIMGFHGTIRDEVVVVANRRLARQK